MNLEDAQRAFVLAHDEEEHNTELGLLRDRATDLEDARLGCKSCQGRGDESQRRSYESGHV